MAAVLLQLLVISPSGFILIMMNNTRDRLRREQRRTNATSQWKCKYCRAFVKICHQDKDKIRGSGGRMRATVWLIQVDGLWCVSTKAFTEALHRGRPKANQRVAYFISQVENVLRRRGRGNSAEVSESNCAIVPVADPNTHVTVVTAAPNKSPNRPSGALN